MVLAKIVLYRCVQHKRNDVGAMAGHVERSLNLRRKGEQIWHVSVELRDFGVIDWQDAHNFDRVRNLVKVVCHSAKVYSEVHYTYYCMYYRAKRIGRNGLTDEVMMVQAVCSVEYMHNKYVEIAAITIAFNLSFRAGGKRNLGRPIGIRRWNRHFLLLSRRPRSKYLNCPD